MNPRITTVLCITSQAETCLMAEHGGSPRSAALHPPLRPRGHHCAEQVGRQ